MLTKLARLQALINRYSTALGSVPLLLVRITVGYGFYVTGAGKIKNISGVIEFFTSLHIPFAQYQAPFVARLEYWGGIMLVLGLFCRPISFLLACTMVVAIYTSDWDAVKMSWDMNNDNFGPASQASFAYLLYLLVTACYGAGVFSLDRIGSFLLQKKANADEE